MKGQETYEAQRALRDNATDTALQARVEALQADAGGTVYRVYASELAGFTKKVAKANKQAAKLGVAGVTVTFHEEGQVVTGKDVFGNETYANVHYVAVTGERPKLAGYEFVATIQHEGDAGNVLREVPGQDKVDLTEFRFAGATCDHCGQDRRRNNTFVVRHEGGEVKRVGSTCLRDFLGGVDAHAAARYAEYLAEFEAALTDDDEEREFFGGGGGERVYALDTYLAHVGAMLRTNGWLSRGEAGFGGVATADQAANNMFTRRYDKYRVDLTDEDHERAARTIAYVREVVAAKDNKSDFDHNLTVAFANDYISTDKFGLVAYAPMALAKHEQREAELQRVQLTSDHVGEVKQRLDLTLTVEAVFEHEGFYGTTFITTLSDADGNVFKWFGSYRLDTGETFTGKWTVKGHGEYKGVKETTITRPAKLTRVGAENLEEVAA